MIKLERPTLQKWDVFYQSTGETKYCVWPKFLAKLIAWWDKSLDYVEAGGGYL